MIQANLKFNIQTSNNGNLDIPLTKGQSLFVLGANGVGKSTLMHNVYTQNRQYAKRILAHRQTWFTSNTLEMTAANKKQTEDQIKNRDSQVYSRWKDDYASARSSISVFDLINSENIRAREITKAVDEDNMDSAKKLSNAQAPIQAINELLSLSNIPITISLEKDEQLFATKNGSAPYSIAELSDGERNALLIATDVLTSAKDSLIIIDEPERHLHRSIISPLLTSLFEKRSDCTFIISTHDVFLPIDHKDSSTLLIRDCTWNGKNIQSWDADLIINSENIPENVRQEILGSKRKILFVEGETKSLDRQIYQLIFPSVSVQPLGDCGQIERAVEGVLKTEDLHWLEVYGLVDADDRTSDQIQELKEKGIIALKCYSVESLYYNIEIVRQVAKKYSEITEKKEDELFNSATSNIIVKLLSQKERLCARLSERKVRKRIMSNLPKHKDILDNQKYNLSLNLVDFHNQEKSIFDDLVGNNDLNGLIERYPVRETPVLNEIAKGFGIDRKTYEGIVRKLIVDNPIVLKIFKDKLNDLTGLIDK